MIGRGVLGNPYLFTQIARYLTDGVLLPDPPLSQRLGYLLEQTRLAVGYKGEYVALKEARQAPPGISRGSTAPPGCADGPAR